MCCVKNTLSAVIETTPHPLRENSTPSSGCRRSELPPLCAWLSIASFDMDFDKNLLEGVFFRLGWLDLLRADQQVALLSGLLRRYRPKRGTTASTPCISAVVPVLGRYLLPGQRATFSRPLPIANACLRSDRDSPWLDITLAAARSPFVAC